MSIVAQIVQSAAASKGDYINKNIPDLEHEVELLTKDLTTHIENVYVKYCKMSDVNHTLLNKAVDCQTILKHLQEDADFVKDKQLNIEDVSNNINKLQLLNMKIEHLHNILSILRLFNEFNEELADSQYLKCAMITNDLLGMVDLLPSDGCEILEVIPATLKEKKSILKQSMHNVFKNNVEISENTHDSSITLKLKKHNQEMEEVISALFLTEEQVAPLHSMAKDLWLKVLTIIVDNEVSLSVKEQANLVTLKLAHISNNKSSYKVVFENLQTVLGILKKYFTYKVSEEVMALEYIGNDIRDNLSELIIKNCLRDTIPSNEEDLESYKAVQEATEDLEKSLLDAHIFNKDTKSIFEYANNVDIHFINKKCKDYLKQTKEIIKKDLHEMVEVGVVGKAEYFSGKTSQEFPRCSISRNVEELLAFCEKVLAKACDTGTSPECAGRLFVTAVTIISNYRTCVPELHKSYLTTLPQQIAVFMNNCEYISHTLTRWEFEYCSKLKHHLDQCDFQNEIKLTSLTGAEVFKKYVDGQMKQVQEIMEGAELNAGPTIEKLGPNTEKSVRQCLRQQELLRTVWHKVLPHDTYNKNIGLVVNCLCDSIVTAVIKFEDISAKAAEELADVIKLVLTRAPKLFIDPKEVGLYVPLWNKLNELSFVLNASLVDINDRWASGKGPLALYFEAAELKQLIKSLFQNTDRRAEVLNRISKI